MFSRQRSRCLLATRGVLRCSVFFLFGQCDLDLAVIVSPAAKRLLCLAFVAVFMLGLTATGYCASVPSLYFYWLRSGCRTLVPSMFRCWDWQWRGWRALVSSLFSCWHWVCIGVVSVCSSDWAIQGMLCIAVIAVWLLGLGSTRMLCIGVFGVWVLR
jgi:hypothetical protein